MSSNSLVYRYIFHGTRLNIDSMHCQSLSKLGLNNPLIWPVFKGGVVLSSGTTTCLKVSRVTEQDVIYFKRYRYTKNIWAFFLRRSKAANELINYQRFKKLQIPTLDVIALYEQRVLGRLNTACIVSQGLPNTLQLDDFYTDVLLKMPKKMRQETFNSVKNQLFSQLKKAHNAGIFHLDLKWRNILIQQNGERYTPIWIDCPRGTQRRYFNYRLKVADLSGVSRKALVFFSPPQLYRMLCEYLGKDANKAEARQLFADISKHLSRRPPKGFLD